MQGTRQSIHDDGIRAGCLASAICVVSWSALCAFALVAVPAGGVPEPIKAAAAMVFYAQDPPPLAHTGGFGEPTCHECHFGSPLDPPDGSLTIDVRGERTRRIRVVLRQEGMERAGFQLAARFATGPEAGEQAGELKSVDDRVSVVTDPGTGVQYAQHTRDGTALSSPGVAVWELEWIPPAAGGESDAGDRSGVMGDSDATDASEARGPPAEVVFHAAANAANYDDSEFGDFVYTAMRVLTEEAD